MILGTYSLGNATRYEDFTELPSGFSVENFVDSSQVFNSFGTSPSTTASCQKGLELNAFEPLNVVYTH